MIILVVLWGHPRVPITHKGCRRCWWALLNGQHWQWYLGHDWWPLWGSCGVKGIFLNISAALWCYDIQHKQPPKLFNTIVSLAKIIVYRHENSASQVQTILRITSLFLIADDLFWEDCLPPTIHYSQSFVPHPWWISSLYGHHHRSTAKVNCLMQTRVTQGTWTQTQETGASLKPRSFARCTWKLNTVDSTCFLIFYEKPMALKFGTFFFLGGGGVLWEVQHSLCRF